MSAGRSRARADQEAHASRLVFRPLTPARMDDLRVVLRGTWGASCWCMYPRLTDAQARELQASGPPSQCRREAMSKRARRAPAPGLVAYQGDEPVGWIAIAPRRELARIDASRATPRVDEVAVWVIPCVTVRKTARGRGIAVALIQAAVAYAAERGAPAIEAYPRAGSQRISEGNAYFGTEAMFRRAGFRVIRKPLKDPPGNWVPRVAMRISTQSTASALTSPKRVDAGRR